MAFNFKTATPDTSIDANAFMFGADSQSSATPSIYQMSVVQTLMWNSPNLVTPSIGVATGTSLNLNSSVFVADNSGNVTATRGFLASGTGGAFNGTFSDGIVIDYVSPTARFSAGSSDGFAWYNNGIGSVSLMSLSSAGSLSVSSLALGGSTIGTNALAVTGTATISSSLAIGGATIGTYAFAVTGTGSISSNFAVGVASGSITLRANKNITGATACYGIRSDRVVQSDVTAAAYYYESAPSTAAASFTLGTLVHYNATQSTIGLNSSITTQYGFLANSNITGATTNYGFYSNIASSTGRWNFVAGGSANNAFAGSTRFGAVTVPTSTVDVTGSIAATTTIRSSGATSGIGYAAGAGLAVTQTGTRTSGVTINAVCGAITLVSAAGSASYQTFTVSNTAVAATDVIIVNQKSGTDLYEVFVTAVAANSFNITYATTGGTSTEQPVFNFAVIKSVAA